MIGYLSDNKVVETFTRSKKCKYKLVRNIESRVNILAIAFLR